MPASLLYPKGYQLFDNNGRPLVNGTVTYERAGTSILLDTYSDADASTPNSNPVQLNASGRFSHPVYIDSSYDAKETVRDATGDVVAPWPYDDIPKASTAGTGNTDITIARTSTQVTVQSSSGDNGVIAAANATEAGVMTAAMFTKLAGIEEGAEVNPSGAALVSAINTELGGSGWQTGGGGVSDGDKGDITVSSSGAVWTIDNGAVSLAKIANIAADRILGNVGTSPAAPAEIGPADVAGLLDSQTLANIGLIGIQATPDTTNRLSVNTPAVLFNNAGDDIQVKLNKDTASDFATFVFQTGFSGRAEIGLAGADDFSFKVSPDGSTFYTGLVIDKDDGVVTFPETPGFLGASSTVNGGKGLVPAPTSGQQSRFLRGDGTWAEPPGASGGEANTASNVGDGAGEVYKEKTGVDLRLKTIKAGSNITVTNNANDITIAASGGGSMTGSEIATALQGEALTQIPSISMRDAANTPNSTYSIQTIQRTASTSDATDTAVLTITLAEGECFAAQFWISAFKADGTGSNTRMNIVTGRRPAAGSANATASSAIGGTTNGTSNGVSNVSTSGNDVSFNVRGEASTNYRFFVEIKLLRYTP